MKVAAPVLDNLRRRTAALSLGPIPAEAAPPRPHWLRLQSTHRMPHGRNSPSQPAEAAQRRSTKLGQSFAWNKRIRRHKVMLTNSTNDNKPGKRPKQPEICKTRPPQLREGKGRPKLLDAVGHRKERSSTCKIKNTCRVFLAFEDLQHSSPIRPTAGQQHKSDMTADKIADNKWDRRG